MRHFFPVFFCVTAGLFSPLQAKNIDASFEESLELRRIAEYWKEKDYQTVKAHISAFLSKNPQSTFTDQLQAMLGDLYFQEGNYKEAIDHYDQISGKEFRQKCLFHKLHCLYSAGKLEEFILSTDLFFKDPNAKAAELDAIHFELAEAYFQKAMAPENEKEKKELFKLALEEYQRLKQAKFSDMALLPQAQIFTFFEEYAKAASLYLLMASKDADKKEEYLFQAACLQLHKDRKTAIETFAAVVALNGKFASKAAFNQLNLLYQEKRYRDFILAQDTAFKHIPQDKQALIQYFLGKSLYHTGDHLRAVNPFMQSLATKSLDRSQEKSALISLMNCAKETQDFVLFEKILAHLKAEFSNEEETANALLMHVHLCRDKKEWSKARSTLQELLNAPVLPASRESLVYDQALLWIHEAKWQEAAHAFEAFLKEFPQSAHKSNALRHLINSRLEAIKTASKETEQIKKQQLLTALAEALQDKQTFSSAERQKIHYLQGKTYFELGQYDETIGELSEYVRDYQKDPTCADAYLLLAYAYQKGSHDEIHFVLNAEKALTLNPHLQNKLDLHLTLFNSYLSLAEKASSDEKPDLIDRAANHLFLALDKPASKENQRWLAGYYFQQYKCGKDTSLERTAIVLEKLLGINSASKVLNINDNTLEMEGEVLKLADVYAKGGRFHERVKLLEAIQKDYQAHPDYPWKYQRLAHFELGKAYLDLGQQQNALQAFADLIASSSHGTSYFATAARLEQAKLEYIMLSANQKSEDSKSVHIICDTLKELEIKRKLHSEPLHLEAALCYIDIKSDLAPSDQKHKQRRFLLEQMRQNFSSIDDPLVKQYLSAAIQFPEKKQLYDQYLAFVDKEICFLDAEENSLARKESEVALTQLFHGISDEALKARMLKAHPYLARLEKGP